MKKQKEEQADYLTPLCIGALMLIGGVSQIVYDNYDSTATMIFLLGGIAFMVIAYLGYKRHLNTKSQHNSENFEEKPNKDQQQADYLTPLFTGASLLTFGVLPVVYDNYDSIITPIFLLGGIAFFVFSYLTYRKSKVV